MDKERVLHFFNPLSKKKDVNFLNYHLVDVKPVTDRKDFAPPRIPIGTRNVKNMQASSVKLHYQTGCVHCDIKKWREQNVIHKRAGHKQIKALKGRVQNKIVSCSARGNVWRLRWFQTLACRTPKRCHVGYMICVKETLTNIVCGVRQNPSVNRYFIEKTNLHYFCVFTEDWKMKIQLAALCLGLTRHRACRSKANFFSWHCQF